MPDRREFLQALAGISAGLCLPGAVRAAEPQQATGATRHAPVMVAGRRVKTIDVHAHVNVPEANALLKGTALERAATGGGGGPATGGPPLNDAGRLAIMDKEGIDVQAVSINPFWYAADRDLATRLIDLQNQKLVEDGEGRARIPLRGIQLSGIRNFPILRRDKMEEGMKMGLKGAAIGGSVEGEELSAPKYDVFWAKAEELQAPIFVHPQSSAQATGIDKRVQGNGVLANVIGNPLETTIFISHMIFEGVLEHHPGLKICCAHGGGYLPSYSDRMDHGCWAQTGQCSKTIVLKKDPSEYMRQLYVDSLVFSPEGLRHLAAVMGPERIMLGTDYPFPWTEAGPHTLGPVDHLFATPGFNDAQKVDILSGTASRWLGIPITA